MILSRPRILATAVAVAMACPALAGAATVEQLEQQLKALQQQIQELKATQSKETEARKELANQLEAQGKEAVVKGDTPNSMRRAGEETSIRVYGFTELNVVHDFGGANAGDYASNPVGLALTGSADAERKGVTYMHARTSRLGVEAVTPTFMGPLSVKVEGDFNNDRGGSNGSSVTPGAQGYTNGYGFRLRHAYGQVGPWLIGQTWSTFMDLDSTPETVDFNGPVGNTSLRQPQIRYTYVTPNVGNFTAALENSVTLVSGSDSAISRVPDLVLRWDKAFDWGTLSTRGVTHELAVKDGGVTANKRGFGLGLGGTVKMFALDTFFWSFTAGNGIGRYLYASDGALFNTKTAEVETERQLGMVFGYQHKFSDTLRGNVVYGQQRLYNGDYVALANTAGYGTINRSVRQAHLGLIWNPFPNVDLGSEFIWAHRETLDGQTGTAPRINLSGKYNFN